MKLYRGFEQRPKGAIPKVVQEYEELIKIRESIASKNPRIIDFLREMGEERFARLVELGKIVGPQFFTDDKEMAKGFAGEKGFLFVMDVPDDVVRNHYRGEEQMAARRELRYGSNFVFSGKELYERKDEWHMDLVDVVIEREGEKPRSEVIAEKRTIDHPIRGADDLSDRDKAALEEMRSKVKRS